MDKPLYEVTSHIAGKNAKVRVYPDRIEWGRAGRVTATRLAAGAMTLGASLAATGARKAGASEMVLMKHITGVRTVKSGLMNHAVQIVTSAQTVEMRCSKAEAEQLAELIRKGSAGQL